MNDLPHQDPPPGVPHTEEEVPLFPIRELAARTQVNTVTIRAWERRYGILKPQRTAKGHRLYTEADVSRVQQALAWIARGVPIGKVRALLDAGELDDHASPLTADQNPWQPQLTALLQAARALSVSRVQVLLREHFLNYPALQCSARLLEPVMQQLADTDTAANAALFSFLQSELVCYAQSRLESDRQQNPGEAVWLVCGRNTPVWRLAVAAIALSDAGKKVSMINQPLELEVALALADQCASPCLLYQDGLWNAQEIHGVTRALARVPGLFLCGSAPAASGVGSAERVAITVEKAVEGGGLIQGRASSQGGATPPVA